MSQAAPTTSRRTGAPSAATDERASDTIRVMLVDDSAVIRRVVTRALEAETDLEVVGTATNGREALDRIDLFRPDVVVLDVEMPVLDGLAALKQLRPRWPALPVIMFSTRTTKGASATLDALSSGANDYSTKPGSIGGSLEATIKAVRNELAPLVRSWGMLAKARSEPASTSLAFVADARPAGRPKPSGVTPLRRRLGGRVDAVVIGCSAGGPNALAELVPQLPAHFPVPILLTQHMPETFTRLLASRLDAQSPLRVVEADHDMAVEKGHLYIARGGSHLTLSQTSNGLVIKLDDGPPENYCRPSVDVMFRSAASVWGANLLAVVLTGMGRDGVTGSQCIVDKGGSVLAQDEESSLVWGMPGAVVGAGLASECLPLRRIASAICERLSTTVVAR